MSRPDYPLQQPLALVPIAALRPTQNTVGMAEVDKKRRRWRGIEDKGGFLDDHTVPVLLGPNRRRYVIDHHHLARALLDEGVPEIAVAVRADPP